MRIRFAFDPFGPFCSWLMAVGAAFSLYCFIVCQAAADPAAWQHHGIYQPTIRTLTLAPIPFLLLADIFAMEPASEPSRFEIAERAVELRADSKRLAELTDNGAEFIPVWRGLNLFAQNGQGSPILLSGSKV